MSKEPNTKARLAFYDKVVFLKIPSVNYADFGSNSHIYVYMHIHTCIHIDTHIHTQMYTAYVNVHSIRKCTYTDTNAQYSHLVNALEKASDLK